MMFFIIYNISNSNNNLLCSGWKEGDSLVLDEHFRSDSLGQFHFLDTRYKVFERKIDFITSQKGFCAISKRGSRKTFREGGGGK